MQYIYHTPDVHPPSVQQVQCCSNDSVGFDKKKIDLTYKLS